MSTENKPIVIFDGVCAFCNRSVNFIIKRDPKAVFLFAPMQSQAAQDLMHRYHIADISNDTFILIKNNRYLLRTDAALEITKDLTGHWYLLRIFIFLPKGFRDWFYNLFAQNRYKLFGKTESCMIPTEDIKNRFL